MERKVSTLVFAVALLVVVEKNQDVAHDTRVDVNVDAQSNIVIMLVTKEVS